MNFCFKILINYPVFVTKLILRNNLLLRMFALLKNFYNMPSFLFIYYKHFNNKISLITTYILLCFLPLCLSKVDRSNFTTLYVL